MPLSVCDKARDGLGAIALAPIGWRLRARFQAGMKQLYCSPPDGARVRRRNRRGCGFEEIPAPVSVLELTF